MIYLAVFLFWLVVAVAASWLFGLFAKEAQDSADSTKGGSRG